MKRNILLKSLAIGAMAAAFGVACAQDFSLFTSSVVGSPTNPAAVSITESFTILPPAGGDPNQYDNLVAPLMSGTVSFTELAPLTPGGAVPVAGSFTVYGPTNASSLTFNLDPTQSFYGVNVHGHTISYSGELIGTLAHPGTGAYSSYVSGYADLVVNYKINATNGNWGDLGSVAGAVQAVPEPASLAVLGLGVVGFLARRRK